MTDFTVFPSREALVRDVVKLWPGADQLDAVQAEELTAHVERAVDLAWGTPSMNSAQAVFEMLTRPARLQAALDEFQRRAQDVAQWSERFVVSPDGRVDSRKLSIALGAVMA